MLCVQERRKLGPAVATAGSFWFSHLASALCQEDSLLLNACSGRGYTFGGTSLNPVWAQGSRFYQLAAEGVGARLAPPQVPLPLSFGPLLPLCPPEAPPIIPQPVGFNVRVAGRKEVLGDEVQRENDTVWGTRLVWALAPILASTEKRQCGKIRWPVLQWLWLLLTTLPGAPPPMYI